ncbi:Separin [Mactra antiquata]
MIKATTIIKSINNNEFEGIKTTLETFVQPVFDDAVGRSEASHYGLFTQNCLKIIHSKIKSIKDTKLLEEVVQASVICGKCYVKLLSLIEEDKTFIVPSFFYLIIQSISDNKLYEHVLEISKIVIDIFEVASFPLPEKANKVVYAFYGFLWKTSCNLLKQGTTVSLRDVLRIRKSSLLFLCYSPVKDNLLYQCQSVFHHYSTYDKRWIDSGTNAAFNDVFNSVVHCLKNQHISDSDTEQINVQCMILQVQGLLIEHFLKTLKVTEASEVINSIQESDVNSPFTSVVKNFYEFSAAVVNSNKLNVPIDIGMNKIKDSNKAASEIIEESDDVKLSVLNTCTSHFVQSLHTKSCEGLPIELLHEIAESCFINRTIAMKILPGYDTPTDCKSDPKKLEIMNTQKYRLMMSYLMANYRQLQVLHLCLESKFGKESSILTTCLDIAENYVQELNKNENIIAEKNVNAHRNNIAFICSTIGRLCLQEKCYNEAIVMYKIVAEQLTKLQSTNLIGVYEKLVECYQHQEEWIEGSKCLIQALKTVDDSLKQIANIWARMKREAVNKDEVLMNVSLNSIIMKSGTKLPNLTSRQILLAEYRAWKNFSRRHHLVEYYIVCELLDISTTCVQKAEAMIAVAMDSCITGQTYKDMDANELLNNAIVMLDKEQPGCESLLAIANYTKYVLIHEDSVEQTKNEVEDKNIFLAWNIDDDKGFTLQDELKNLPFLVRAIELWETDLKNEITPTNKKTKQRGKKKETTKKRESTDDETDEQVFDLTHNIDCLIMCASRLLTMKQPQLAERALQVAKQHITSLKDKDKKRSSELTLCLTRALLSLGKYEEAESVMDAKGDNKTQISSVTVSLVMSELYLLLGKREEGLSVLQALFETDQMKNKSKNVNYILNQGTAKRLLSMSLCLPSVAAQLNTSSNQHLLSLAFDAVHCHISVLNYLTKNGLSKNADKWLMLNEVLSSILHLCQLYRFIGLPKEGLCYLRAGLHISQGQGLPRWSCEFLCEMLSSQSMEAASEKALQTVEYLNCIISPVDRTKTVSIKESDGKNNVKKEKMTKDLKPVKDGKPNQSEVDVPMGVGDTECFGFKNLGVTPVKHPRKTSEHTPERISNTEDLGSERKRKMSQLEIPECICMKESKEKCTDQNRHKLCVRAGVVLSDFLTQNGMKTEAQKLLNGVQTKYKLPTFLDSSVTGDKTNDIVLKNVIDPSLLYSYLEVACIQAESYLDQKEFYKVHMIWKSLQDLEQSGCLRSVLHSNILLTRLALCDATGYMLSLHSQPTESMLSMKQAAITDISANGKVSASIDVPDGTIVSTKKKVSFGDDSDTLIVTGTKLKTSRRKLLNEDIEPVITEQPKSVVNLLNTPRVKVAFKAKGLQPTTPSAKIATLERMMAGESDTFTVLHDDDVLFPQPKPVTPRTAPKSKIAKSKCKTEPRNLKNKKQVNVLEDSDSDSKIACNLDELLKDNDEDIVFPISKPVTPKPVKSLKSKAVSKSSAKCRTEPRNSKKGKVTDVGNSSIDDNDVICKLNMTDEENADNTDTDKATDTDAACEMNEKLTRNDNDVNDGDKEIAKATNVQNDPSETESIKRKIVGSKSRLPKQKTKSLTSDKAVSFSNDADSSVYVFKESSVKSLNNRRRLLSDKTLKKKETEVESNNVLPKTNNDVFDFDLEDSPCVPKESKVKKGKQVKATQKGRKTKETAGDKKLVQSDDTNEEKENVDGDKRPRGRRRQNREIETVRRIHDYRDMEMELDISLEDMLDFESDFDNSIQHDDSYRYDGETSVTLAEVNEVGEMNDGKASLSELDLEPIEIMRGRRVRNTRNSKKNIEETESNKKEIDIAENESENDKKRLDLADDKSESKNVDDDNCIGVEKMRSGRAVSIKKMLDCIEKEEEITVVPIERPLSGVKSPCEEDIISTLESLYARLCQFPPNPQHSDTCHMLALHHMEKNPKRAAFLLSDAMAVTFRHQVLLNSNRKARKSAEKQNSTVENGTGDLQNSLFSKEDENLDATIKAIPADWCVVQLSVVSYGSSWKQMILTRFVKDKSPIVLKLPGFSSPQGQTIIKEFSSIMEQGSNTRSIENISEWWNIRSRLDSELYDLVQRMEKYWLGVWKCALIPGKCRPELLKCVQKDITKITQSDIDISYIELLLLAEKTCTSEKDLKQCIEHVVSCNIDQTDIDKISVILKKYSKCIVSHSDTQHIILILDKTVQHLPWEGMKILSQRSVSRMPCLSHIVSQLNHLQANENSVLVKGVNPKNTYYILNPDLDLPRTEQYFKDWFVGEEGWKGVVGCVPTSEQYVEALTERDLLIYCGHGSGGRFFTSYEIEKLSCRAVALLMGCSSGRLLVRGQLEASGMMISYFLAGCPSMVANLWDVTDKDIDKFTGELVKTWFNSCDGTYLAKEVQKARFVCKLQHLNGFAPVVYGLPVFIRNGKH